MLRGPRAGFPWSGPSSLHSPALPQLSPPDMSSTIDSSNIPTDGTGKLEITHIVKYNSNSNQKKKLGVIQLDPWLEPHRDVLKHRYQVVEEWAKAINETEGGLDKFSKVNDIPIDCYPLN